MDENDISLTRLSQVYEKLDDEEKGKVIRLAEGLLNCQKGINNGEVKTENVVFNSNVK
jgi:hypothetical protein